MAADDVCAVCGETRENHGDANHEFDMFNDFPVPKKTPEPPRQEPPKERTKPDEAVRIQAAAFATLVEILAERQVLGATDIIRIFSARP